MPRITGRLEDGRIRIKVGVRPDLGSSPVDGISTPTNLNYQECMALVDTGARRTCVTENLVQKLSLQRMGRIDVWNIKRAEPHWTYLFHVAIWPDSDDGSPQPPFGIGPSIEGIDVGNHPYFEMLIGMDIISQGRLVIERNGAFEMSF